MMDKHVNYSGFNLQLLPLWCFSSQPKLEALQARVTGAVWSWAISHLWILGCYTYGASEYTAQQVENPELCFSMTWIQIPVLCSVTFWVPHFPSFQWVSLKIKCIDMCKRLPVNLPSKGSSCWYCYMLFSSLLSLPWVLLVCRLFSFPNTFLLLWGNFVACFSWL